MSDATVSKSITHIRRRSRSQTQTFQIKMGIFIVLYFLSNICIRNRFVSPEKKQQNRISLHQWPKFCGDALRTRTVVNNSLLLCTKPFFFGVFLSFLTRLYVSLIWTATTLNARFLCSTKLFHSESNDSFGAFLESQNQFQNARAYEAKNIFSFWPRNSSASIFDEEQRNWKCVDRYLLSLRFVDNKLRLHACATHSTKVICPY